MVFVERLLPLPAALPQGVHELHVAYSAGRCASVRVFVPPPAATRVTDALADSHAWGLFVPIWAARGRGGAHTGDLGDLRELAEGLAPLGSGVVATLPLGPAFLGDPGLGTGRESGRAGAGDAPFEPSPYAPLSRRYWNELYVDLTAAPGFSECPEARAAVEGLERAARLGQGGGAAAEPDIIDYRRAWARVLPALEALARRYFEGGGGAATGAALEDFRTRCPDAGSYAAFRAKVDATGSSWWGWDDEARAALRRDVDPPLDERARTYLFAQLCLDAQLERLSQATHLYLDLPLGVAPDGYDTLRAPDAYALDMSLGAPPDLLFSGGQTWGLPPLRPDHGLESGLGELRRVPDAQMRFASVLRIDHVMGLHRQFWVPRGMSAREGVYVTMPADALWAVHCLASRRNGCALVGEDLGTVPPDVRERLRLHRALRMHVVQNELLEDPDASWMPPDAQALATLNTHDMPPFAAFASADEVADRVDLGLIDEGEASAEREGRATIVAALRDDLGLPEDADATALFEATTLALAASDAPLVIINVEDLWGERRPQNVPGTWRERPNWRRPLARPLSSVSDDPRVRTLLDAVEGRRSQRRVGRVEHDDE
jgi:4-alpha-glucanotransferase